MPPRTHRQQGALAGGRVGHGIADVDARHVVVAARRPALGCQAGQGHTRDQLYEEARHLGVEGRSSMNKEQLRRAVDAKKR